MKILLADEHAMFREAVESTLSRVTGDGPLDVLHAATWDDAHAILQEHADTALAVFDINVPGMRGAGSVRYLKARFREIPVVVLANSATSAFALACLQAGADGFIPKTTGSNGLVNAVRLVLGGDRYVPWSYVEDFLTGQHRCFKGTGKEKGVLLSAERTLLELVARGHTNKEIARLNGVQEITIKKRLSKLYQKFGLSSRAEAGRFWAEFCSAPHPDDPERNDGRG